MDKCTIDKINFLRKKTIRDEISKNTIDKLISSEQEAVREYEEALKESLNDEEKEMLEEILNDEKDHLKMLQNYKQNGKAEILDSCVKDEDSEEEFFREYFKNLRG